MPSSTIISNSKISVPGISASFGNISYGGFKFADFKKKITYKYYKLNTGNLLGDFDRSNYVEVIINGEIRPVDKNHLLVRMGELDMGDAELFLPARIRQDVDGNTIEEIRPKINDEVSFYGETWRIKTVSFEYAGSIEISCYCLAGRLSTNTTIEDYPRGE